MTYPEREQRHHTDVFPGMTFYFVDNPNEYYKRNLFDTANEHFDRAAPWTVIAKERVEELYEPVNSAKHYWKYLLLGPGPTLAWHDGSLGWIRRVSDPVWEERECCGWGRMADTMNVAAM